MESFKPILEKIKKIKQEKGYTNEVLIIKIRYSPQYFE